MIIEVNGKRPKIGRDVYVAPTAVIIGDVVIEDNASVWFGAVIRGDEGRIVIGARTNVQDNTVIHVNSKYDTLIESDVTIGHGVVMEGCYIEKGVLIGMNATVLTGSNIGEGAFIAAGSVIREKQEIPSHHLAAGVPAKVIRPISESLRSKLVHAPEAYMKYNRAYAGSAIIISQ